MSEPGRRILILGGTGFIGQPLATRLARLGDFVTTVSRSARADVRLDARDLTIAREFLTSETFDAVINLMGAGLATDTEDPGTLTTINAHLPGVVLRTLIAHHPRTRLIHAGSSTERLASDAADESDYSRTKHEGAESLRALASSAIEPVTLLRIHNTYGPGQPITRFIAGTVTSLMSNHEVILNYPDRVRDFVFLDDVVASFVSALDNSSPGLNEVELGTGVGSSLYMAAREIAHILERPVELVTRARPASRDPHPFAVAARRGGTYGTCLTSLRIGLTQTIGDH